MHTHSTPTPRYAFDATCNDRTHNTPTLTSLARRKFPRTLTPLEVVPLRRRYVSPFFFESLASFGCPFALWCYDRTD